MAFTLRESIRVMSVAVMIVGALGATPNGWTHKAVANEATASAIVGGFSPAGGRDYHAGLNYIRAQGIQLGALTIGEVVEQGKKHPLQPSSRPTQPVATGWPAGTITAIALVVSGVLVVIFLSGRRSSAATQGAARVDTRTAQREISTTRALAAIAVPGIIHKDGEIFYHVSENVALIAEHHHARYVGRYAGVSVRVTRGVSLRTGSSRGRRVDQVTLDQDDRGRYVASNKRLIFLGARKTIEVPLTKVVSIDRYTDGLKINRSNAASVVLITGSEAASIETQRIIASDLLEHPTVQVQLQQATALLNKIRIEHAAGTVSDEDLVKVEAKLIELKHMAMKAGLPLPP